MLAGPPVRLQTELEPEAGQPDAFAFRITPRPTRTAPRPCCTAPARCARLPAPPPAPGIDSIERSRFSTRQFGGRKQFYDQMTAVIGEYFQYGPHFQVVRESLEDPRTKELLLDLRMGGALWRDSQRAGYRFPPALLDGGLQSFLCYMMQCSDVCAVPRRLEDFTVDRLPTSARLACHYVPPAPAGLHARGQLALPLGEHVSGTLTLYDAATGERVARLGTYLGAFANPRQDVLARSRHVVRWQPKGVPPAVADALAAAPAPAAGTGLDELISALLAARAAPDGAPPMLRVAEFAQDAPGGCRRRKPWPPPQCTRAARRRCHRARRPRTWRRGVRGCSGHLRRPRAAGRGVRPGWRRERDRAVRGRRPGRPGVG